MNSTVPDDPTSVGPTSVGPTSVGAASVGAATDGTVSADVSTELSELARSIHDEPAEIILQTVVEEAIEIIPGTDFASLSLITQRRHIESVVHSAPLPHELDQAQSRLGQGPCLDAIYHERTIRVPDMAAEMRWPDFSREALASGVNSMLAIQLFVEADNLGALNLYSQRTGAFTEESEHVGLNIAAHAALALAETRTRGQLHEAVTSRDVIGQAKGILMERYKVTAHEAFQLLAAASSHTNRKLRVIADELVRSGELPRFTTGE